VQTLDLFAGPGGWDVAATRLGLDPLGIEWDEAACATREAAGLRTIRADVASAVVEHGGMSIEDHHAQQYHHWPTESFSVLVASPPCQAWSMAGKRGGQKDIDLCVRAAHELAAGNDTRAELRKDCEDPRSMLVVEPIRWAAAMRPSFIALEQVPPVLGFWTLTASLLESLGYSCWTGILEAERYGVPQTRERAILMAALDEQPHPPKATHQRYVSGEPQRHDVTLEGEILPWVSMAEALGWEGADRPGFTVLAGGLDRRSRTVRPSCAPVAFRLARGAGMNERHGERRDIPEDEPAPVITSKARTAEWHYRNGNQPNAARRPVDEPAPTLHFGHALNSGVEWTTTPDDAWTSERLATAVQGDPRIARPGHTGTADGKRWQMDNAVRVTQEQAAILQTFPPDYPWQGSRTKQFEQIGNAVPPLLAEAILRALLPASVASTRNEP